MVKNKSHTLAYSLVALQEMNLAYRFPILFWNCACLISDSGGAESEEGDEEGEIAVCDTETHYDNFEELIDKTDDEDDDEDEDDGETVKKKKTKAKGVDYGRIATAIGKLKAEGVKVVPPDINKSSYTFSPDLENNAIRYGLSGINRIGEDIIKNIMSARPYEGIDDFLNKVKLNKPQMVNLIKAGAFDSFGERTQVMREYIEKVSDTKKRVTLQNMKMLIDFNLIPENYSFQCKVYNFNKYIKKLAIDGTYYGLNDIAFNFYSQHFDVDKLIPLQNKEYLFKIKKVHWDAYYQSHMDIIRPWVQKNAADLLVKINSRIISNLWDKYCKGGINKWEMDSVSFYSHEHELANVDMDRYEFTNFFDLPEEPVVDKIIPIKGKMIPLLRLSRICGTVLDKDKNKKTVTLLTTEGVVVVKIFGAVFTQYDKQISERGADGKKHVIEKSTFSRGNKIIVCGIREGDTFRAKKYSKTPYHLVETIEAVYEDGTIIKRHRSEQEE